MLKKATNYADIFTCHEQCLPYSSIYTCLNYICPSICLFDSRVWLKQHNFSIIFFIMYQLKISYISTTTLDLRLFFKLQCNHLLQFFTLFSCVLQCNILASIGRALTIQLFVKTQQMSQQLKNANQLQQMYHGLTNCTLL